MARESAEQLSKKASLYFGKPSSSGELDGVAAPPLMQASSVENFDELSVHNRVAPFARADNDSVMSRELMGSVDEAAAQREAKPPPPPREKRQPPPPPADAVNGRAPGARPRPPPPPRTAEYGWDKRGSAERSSEEKLGSLEESTIGSLRDLSLPLGELSYSPQSAKFKDRNSSVSSTPASTARSIRLSTHSQVSADI